MGLYFLKGGRQAVQAAAQLVDFAGFLPTRELAADFARVGIASKQQSGIEDRLILDNFYQLRKFHADKIP